MTNHFTYTCPNCTSHKIAQYRMPTGSMWCQECGYKVEHKEDNPNPFIPEEPAGDRIFLTPKQAGKE